MAEEKPDTDLTEQAAAEDPGTESAGAAVTEAEDVDPGQTEAPSETPQAEEPKRPRKRLPRRLRPQRTKPKRAAAAARKPLARTAKQDSERGRRQERRGVVVSDKGDKTIVVSVD